ncbi:FAD-dependent oxidoreductase [Saccharopolyspora sp. HNM0983]|uniref:ferredoxin--NADP(+) reductase n=1 Tax=Saccharopolyspora montiporae TaxID=2781240 RepID=A0A929BDQ0_9PSEU|nr:FAD-dependent oxidoreductase [Saccharopolyspora sp. HNM0983]MBE9376153.1 FAD-dependent oxidoreductase [Saccharopolyspora sp. HNM0983]
MAYAITQTCCADASCVAVCPVNCIHPTPDEPDFGTTDTLYIDPRTCIDCGACADACPVEAIFPVDRLFGADAAHAELNRRHFTGEADDTWSAPRFPRSLPRELAAPRVAVVGTGPAAGYAVQNLLRSTEAEITVLDRSPVPGGLIRYGVAPDHPSTKRIWHSFATAFQHPRVRMHLNVDVGNELTHQDLQTHHHAVIYAVGAAGDRRMGIPGEELTASIPATDFVGWCNAAPDVGAEAVDLSAQRAVVVGTGNVALDVARILLSDPDELAGTDIAEHALAALRRSAVREVVLLARRGPAEAAYTIPEFLDLRDRLGIEIVVDDHGDPGAAIAAADPASTAGVLAQLPVRGHDWQQPPAPGARLVLRFHSAPEQLLGSDRVQAVRTAGTDIAAGLVVRAIGNRGTPVPGVAFDEHTGTIPHTAGRVEPGTYVVGWAKRGARGGIGANRGCAAETVDAVLDDIQAGTLRGPTAGAGDFERLVRARSPQALGWREAESIDRSERARGRRVGRPRVKFATLPDLLAAGRRRR